VFRRIFFMNFKPTILYVEDEESIRKQLERFLRYFSSKLFVAENGEVGLSMFKNHQPDIVISDIRMPKMNGIDMVKKIKELNQEQHIIFTTAHSESRYFIDAIDLQVDGYILKPINLKNLEKKILEISKHIFNIQELKSQRLLIDEIADVQDHFIVVLDKMQSLIYANQMFLAFCDVKSIGEFKKKHNSLDEMFLLHEEFEHHHTESEVRKLKQTNQTFLLSKNEIRETQHTVISITEITNLADETQRYKDQAYHDALTQIYNRAYFDEVMLKEIARHKREHTALSCIIFDIDLFKNFNDTYGHDIGDIVLKELAVLVQKYTRGTDTFARWGGEEFVEILPNSSLQGALKVAEILREIVQKHVFVNNLSVTCSFGVAEFSEGDDASSLLKKADNALYKAKEKGRNRVES